MRFTSPSRRAASLLAVTTIGLSTAVLSVTGVASAAGSSTTTTFSTDAGADVDEAGVFVLSTDGDCTITWDLVGAAGGASDSADGPTSGAKGGHYTATSTASDGAAFVLRAGLKGGDADYEDESPGVAGTNGSDWSSDGMNGVLADGVYGGGGGAASVVTTYDGVPYLGAFGGDGGSASGSDGSGGLMDGNEDYADSTEGTDKTPSGSGDGVISGSMTCVTETVDDSTGGGTVTDPDDGDEYGTGAPYVNWVSGDTDSLDFQLVISTVDDDAPVTGVEYSLDKGAWKAVDTENAGDYQYSGTIEGLEAGTNYSVRFRFTTDAGPTEASDAYAASTLVPGPTDVKTSVGASSVTVTWAPPADDSDVTGYHVAISYSDGESGGLMAETTVGAEARTATLVVPAGRSYQASVASILADGTESLRSDFVDTDVVPAPTAPNSLPTADGDLGTDGGSALTAGDEITLSGDGFLPGSTVTLAIYSTPTVLGTVDVDADGSFTTTVTLPDDLPNGDHHLVAAGLDENGDPYYLVTAVTVSGGVDVLAYTGFSALPYAGAGLVALLAGAGLLVASRRRAG